jgi:hypothetical protein
MVTSSHGEANSIGDEHMKYVLAFAMFASINVAADTVIYYDDGSTYTLETGQEVYISNKGVFKATGGLNNWLSIKRLKPWSKRDYTGPTQTEIDQCETGLGFGHVSCPPKEEPEEETQPCDELGFGGTCSG